MVPVCLGFHFSLVGSQDVLAWGHTHGIHKKRFKVKFCGGVRPLPFPPPASPRALFRTLSATPRALGTVNVRLH